MSATVDALYTTSTGTPVSEPYSFQRIGNVGPLLLQDSDAIEALAHFARERIPERVVHARGAGAHGYIEVTHDITDLTCAALFSKVGNRAPVTMRHSLVVTESGSADTIRDTHGFAVKIKTEEGNLDWVFNNSPVFFIRDPSKFPALNHTHKRNPATHLPAVEEGWDFFSQNPETIHQIMINFSDRGTPDGYHRVHGYSGSTYKFINAQGKFTYIRVQLRNDRGFKTLTGAEAQRLAGENPDYGIQAMYEDIERGEYPSWTVLVQTMTPEQAEHFRYSILDMTKVWPHADFPLRPCARVVLDHNPANYFAEVEQLAFSPSRVVPGWAPSADPVLQARLFAYPDAARYRLGVNHAQLPANAPAAPVANFQRDGAMALDNQGARPNYASSLAPMRYRTRAEVQHEVWLGRAMGFLSEVTELDFEQPRALWQKVFSDADRERFVGNIAPALGGVRSAEIKARQLAIFAAVDQSLSDRIAEAIKVPPVQPLKVKSVVELEGRRSSTLLINEKTGDC
ncbi:catalase [Epithele typhae]|uniref:catalase n=1 Tax=Epithele typhae TaxID=378194 RepID=UPI0020072387|nr:catalase [Epithele typhae]KAH9940767.1 catalase [Epithele typhae]